jgi:hypothetical protein
VKADESVMEFVVAVLKAKLGKVAVASEPGTTARTVAARHRPAAAGCDAWSANGGDKADEQVSLVSSSVHHAMAVLRIAALPLYHWPQRVYVGPESP